MDPLKTGEGNREAPLTGAHIGRSVVIKGELSGSENLYIDGEVQGTIQLDGHSLTIGQNGRVQASLKAKDVIVHGRVDGSVTAGDRLDLRKTAVLVGDVRARRLSIEDGAFLKGKVEANNSEAQNSSQPKQESKPAAAIASAGAANSGPAAVSAEAKR